MEAKHSFVFPKLRNSFVIKPKFKTSFKLENVFRKSISFLWHLMKGGTIWHFFDKNVEILLTGMCKGFCHKKVFKSLMV